MAAAAQQTSKKQALAQVAPAAGAASTPVVNVSLTKIARACWEEAFSYLPIEDLVESVGLTCKYFRFWVGGALKLEAEYHRQDAGGNERPNTGFYRYLQAFKSFRGEELNWTQFAATYANKKELSFHNIEGFPRGFLRAVQTRCAPTLESLHLVQSGDIPSDFKDLAALIRAAKKLRRVLIANFPPVFSDVLLECRHLKSLTFSQVCFCRGDNEAEFGNILVKLLSSPIKLEEFHQDVIDMTVPILKALATQAGLKKLTIGNAKECEHVYAPHALGLPSEPIRQQLIITLAALTALESLHLKEDCNSRNVDQPDKYYVANATLEAVAKSSAGLRELFLQNCSLISAEGVAKVVAGCPGLTALSLTQDYVEPVYEHVPVADPMPVLPLAAPVLAADAPMPMPPATVFESVNPLTDEFVCILMQQQTALKTLRLGSALITDVAAHFLAKGCRQLETIDLRGCKVTDMAMSALICARLAGHMPRLSHVDLRETEEFYSYVMLEMAKARLGLFTAVTDGYRYDVAGGKITEWRW